MFALLWFISLTSTCTMLSIICFSGVRFSRSTVRFSRYSSNCFAMNGFLGTRPFSTLFCIASVVRIRFSSISRSTSCAMFAATSGWNFTFAARYAFSMPERILSGLNSSIDPSRLATIHPFRDGATSDSRETSLGISWSTLTCNFVNSLVAILL